MAGTLSVVHVPKVIILALRISKGEVVNHPKRDGNERKEEEKEEEESRRQVGSSTGLDRVKVYPLGYFFCREGR